MPQSDRTCSRARFFPFQTAWFGIGWWTGLIGEVRVEYAENAQEIEESEPRVGETNSGATAETRLKSGGTRAETALFCNGYLPVGAWRAGAH